MASEIQFDFTTGRTCYVLLRTAVGTIWNGAAFESYVTGNYATYDIAATEQGTASGLYVANMPAVAAGLYELVAKDRAGGSPVESDQTVGVGSLIWTGTAVEYQSGDSFAVVNSGTFGNAALKTILDGIAADLPNRITKNTALNGFQFVMIDAADHVTGKTGLTVTAQRSLDGGAFAACTNAPTEIGNGAYTINLSAADTNGNTILLKFSALDADTRFILIATQPT